MGVPCRQGMWVQVQCCHLSWLESQKQQTQSLTVLLVVLINDLVPT